MGHCWKKYTIDYALDQVGKVCGRTNEFSAEMDSIQFYNYPKNGIANSCKIFVDNSILHGCTDPTAEEDIECAKWTALAVTYEPQSPGANAGAGCVQSVGYYKKHGAWIDSTEDMACGDEIYYASSDYVSSDNPDGVYHTGLIVDWGKYEELNGRDGFKVVEGNTDGGYVAIKYVSFGDSKIYGAGRPDYDGWELASNPTPDPEPVPEPTPTPDPKPEPKLKKYQVHTNGGILRLRSAPNTSSAYLIGIPNGTDLDVEEIVSGEMINWNEDWAHTTYNGYTGYVSCAWLVEI